MYICDKCKKSQPSGHKPNLVVTKRVEVTYPARKNANTWKKNRTIEHSDDPGGKGTQIVKEEKYCNKCLLSMLDPRSKR